MGHTLTKTPTESPTGAAASLRGKQLRGGAERDRFLTGGDDRAPPSPFHHSCVFACASTYGVVLKARHKETGQIVAIKKIKESDKDEKIRQNTVREVRILKVGCVCMRGNLCDCAGYVWLCVCLCV